MTQPVSKEEMSPGTLARAVTQGNAAAEQQLVARYRPGLISILRQKTNDSALAEDIAQDALITCILRLREGTVDEPDKLTAFVQQTARFMLTEHFRKQQRRRTDTDLEAIVAREADIQTQEEAVYRSELAVQVRSWLASLKDDRQREILSRHFLTGQTKQSIAEDMGITPNNYDVILHRAKKKLADLVAELGPDYV